MQPKCTEVHFTKAPRRDPFGQHFKAKKGNVFVQLCDCVEVGVPGQFKLIRNIKGL